MGCRIIEGVDGGDSRGYAVFYCSTSMWAFGPVMTDLAEAEAFFKFLKRDPRTYSNEGLEIEYRLFRRKYDPDAEEEDKPLAARTAFVPIAIRGSRIDVG